MTELETRPLTRCEDLGQRATETLREAGEPELADYVDELDRWHTAGAPVEHMCDPGEDPPPRWVHRLSDETRGLVVPLWVALTVATLMALRPEHTMPMLAVVAGLTAAVTAADVAVSLWTWWRISRR